MPHHALSLGIVCTLAGIAAALSGAFPLGYANWTLWFLGCAALVGGGLWSAMRFTPIPDLMLRTAPVPAKARPRLTVIRGGKDPSRG